MEGIRSICNFLVSSSHSTVVVGACLAHMEGLESAAPNTMCWTRGVCKIMTSESLRLYFVPMQALINIRVGQHLASYPCHLL
ncbi:hypothetical protein RRG08_010588 [Elysia crispata]|uniref:Uncharacterized protein n=1 Tax=Elysia crispata TaxID=231223 RepID=A0AAE1ECD3_9GAST|nr:hypothetical protein RRG08_010588 [Elysia crispata]